MPCDILNDKIERHLQQYLAPALFLLRGKLTPSGVLLILSLKELAFVRHDSEKIKDTYSNLWQRFWKSQVQFLWCLVNLLIKMRTANILLIEDIGPLGTLGS